MTCKEETAVAAMHRALRHHLGRPAVLLIGFCALLLATEVFAEPIPAGGFEGDAEAVAQAWTFGAGVTVEPGDAAEGEAFLQCAGVEASARSRTSPRSTPGG